MMRYKLARLKVAKWGYTLYRSPAFRLRIKRKFAARSIQRWFFIDCQVKRLKQKNNRSNTKQQYCRHARTMFSASVSLFMLGVDFGIDVT